MGSTTTAVRGLRLLRAALLTAGLLLLMKPDGVVSGAKLPAETEEAMPEETRQAEAAALRITNPYGTLVIREEEFVYCYEAVISQLRSSAGEYVSMLGLDPQQPLDRQPCPISERYDTWEDYFTGETTDMLTRMGAVYLEAVSIGEAPEAQEAVAEERIAYISAVSDARLSRVGEDCVFTEEELERWFQAHLDDYRSVTYLLAFVPGGGCGDQTADAIVQALCDAESAGAFSGLTQRLTGAPVSRVENIRKDEMGNPQAEDVRWLLAPDRRAGDVYIGENNGDSFVLYFLASDTKGFGEDRDGEWKTAAEEAMREERKEEYLSQLLAVTEAE